ncbi:MAG: filamentous hemagglutinin N-terminal domain-containing protein, partial [Alphaproteobacteria bacterium]
MTGQITRRGSSKDTNHGLDGLSTWGQAGLPVRMERRRHRFALRATSAITSVAVVGSSLLSSAAYALPQGGTVIEGDATISYGENSVVINQGSSHVIIEWQSFDIAAHESVHFDQAAFMAALNRVLSGEASVILGSLTGAGSITLVNPAGIAFGAGAHVDVGAITASTLDILNQNFMADQLVFDQYDPNFATASVTNAGTITVADQGLAALVGPGVANNGLIQARTGAVVLASGTAFTVDFYGDGLINFAVTGATEAAPVDAYGNP